MFRLDATKRFQKNLKAFLFRHPEMEGILEERLTILTKDPWDARLKTHKLSGALRDCHACAASYEYRIVFIIGKEAVTLLAIGTHDEVY